MAKLTLEQAEQLLTEAICVLENLLGVYVKDAGEQCTENRDEYAKAVDLVRRLDPQLPADDGVNRVYETWRLLQHIAAAYHTLRWYEAASDSPQAAKGCADDLEQFMVKAC